MNRRELLKRSAALGVAAVGGASWARSARAADTTRAASLPLPPPAQGSIPVAFLVSDGAVVIDFCGPWEVFQDVGVPGRDGDAFRLYTVAATTTPIRASAGLQIVPDHTFETAPPPKVIVIPAQHDASEAALDWIRKSARTADLVMSVCAGASLLARTGLLAGKSATTHHDFYRGFAIDNPAVRLKRGVRFVDEGAVATAGGLSSGIDLALHVVERYYGHEVAQHTAYDMEYQGKGWTDPDSNQVYAVARKSTDAHPLCPICEMDVEKRAGLTSVYEGKSYYFCSADHKRQFDATPARIVEIIQAP